jgi:hypothetical protein
MSTHFTPVSGTIEIDGVPFDFTCDVESIGYDPGTWNSPPESWGGEIANLQLFTEAGCRWLNPPDPEDIPGFVELARELAERKQPPV